VLHNRESDLEVVLGIRLKASKDFAGISANTSNSFYALGLSGQDKERGQIHFSQ
jgi:hypothetical protein